MVFFFVYRHFFLRKRSDDCLARRRRRRDGLLPAAMGQKRHFDEACDLLEHVGDEIFDPSDVAALSRQFREHSAGGGAAADEVAPKYAAAHEHTQKWCGDVLEVCPRHRRVSNQVDWAHFASSPLDACETCIALVEDVANALSRAHDTPAFLTDVHVHRTLDSLCERLPAWYDPRVAPKAQAYCERR